MPPLGYATYSRPSPQQALQASVYIMQNSQHSQCFTPKKTLTEAPTGHWVTSETGPKRKTSTLPKKPWLFHLEKQYGENNVCNSTHALQCELLETRQNHILWATSATKLFRKGQDIVHSKLNEYMSALAQNSIYNSITKQTTFQQQMVQNNITASTKPNVTVPAFSFHSLPGADPAGSRGCSSTPLAWKNYLTVCVSLIGRLKTRLKQAE